MVGAESSLKSSDKAGGTQLSEDDLGNLFDHLNPHAAKWRTIGTNLGFHPAELDNIQSKTMLIPEAPSSFLNELLSQWLQWAPDPANRASKRNYATLGTLQSAVRRAGLGRVAAELKME